MFRTITIEREYGCGAAQIARDLARRLGWRVWDHELTEEIAKLANVDCSVVERCDERMDGTFQRLAKVFWRASYERSVTLPSSAFFNADRMVSMVRQVVENATQHGNCVIVGRGAPYFLRERPEAFHAFLYAPRAEKMRRILQSGKSEKEAEDLLDTVDRDRVLFIKHYFNADWPTRYLYHIMLNTAVGDDCVIATILNTMHMLERLPAPV
jgi:cytidylate kinase